MALPNSYRGYDIAGSDGPHRFMAYHNDWDGPEDGRFCGADDLSDLMDAIDETIENQEEHGHRREIGTGLDGARTY